MKLGVFTVVLYGRPLPEVLAYLHGIGVQTVELGTGGHPGTGHLDPADFLNDPAKVDRLKTLLADNQLEISALSCHGNPVHPNKAAAAKFHEDFVKTCQLAQKLGVDTVVTFSGCPGDCPDSKLPNWVTCSWPPDFGQVLDYQWNEVLIPYWKDAVKLAGGYGVTKIALEMHPGFCVYNTSSLLRLREAVGPEIGANFDPSHLLWQWMDPCAAIRALRDCIFHFHAKDTVLNAHNIAVNGVLDTGSYGDALGRSWLFRTVGYGSDAKLWKEIFSTLSAIGYDSAVSIEHEDALMSAKEGLEKAVEFLKKTMIFERPGEMWWA